MIEYETPEIFQDSDEDSIHERMLAVLPDDIDKSSGGIVWDLTRPTAIEVARFKGWDMNYAIQMIFPLFAADNILDYHGESRGLSRKQAIKATGTLTVEGVSGGEIKAGDLFSTESINGQQNVSYEAAVAYVIPSSGTIDIDVVCTEAGTIGNTGINTVILVETTNESIESVTNSAAIKGGINKESDDDYRTRILEYDRAKDVSYVGSVADYKRWANEVAGVGVVNVIPAQNNTGTVTLVIVDGNGDPAGETLCTNVYNHIMRPDNPDERLAPLNALLVVKAPTTQNITVTATVKLDGVTVETATNNFKAILNAYLKESVKDKEVRYTKVCKALADTTGVYDFESLLLNGSSINVTLTSDSLPIIQSVTLTPDE